MNRQKILQTVLDIATRRKKHEFVQQLTCIGSLPIWGIDIQCQKQPVANR
jgi:hypothetical protein